MNPDIATVLRKRGIQPSAQRVAVARYVLQTEEHPSADQVWARVREGFPMVSRATIYNTLNLFVSKGLVQEHILAEGRVIFDPNLQPHHHFVDEETGAIVDVPWDALKVEKIDMLHGLDIRQYQVVMRGRRRMDGPSV